MSIEKDTNKEFAPLTDSLEAPKGPSKVIEIVDPQAGKLKETVVDHLSGADRVKADPQQVLQESIARAGFKSLREAATVATFPALLRDGLKAILFDSYNQEPTTYQGLVFNEPSNKPAEDWLELDMLGVLPNVPEGAQYPEIDGSVNRAVRIVNNKKGAIFGITEELTRFDRLNMIKQYPRDLGMAAKITIEQAVYSVLTTTGNYTSTVANGGNDIGNNTGTVTFSAEALVIAYATLRTMKNERSGRYLGIVPDTLIVAPQLEMAAKQLLLSPQLWGMAAVSTTAAYGTGTTNPFRGLITNLIVSPYVGTVYGWILGKAGRGLVYQEVDPLQMLTLADPNQGQLSEGYFVYDKLRYRVREWFGTGFTNQRFWYYSNSTTKPVVL